MLDGEGLAPTAEGKPVCFSGQERAVLDGPLAETEELIAGFLGWRQVRSMEEAVEWLKARSVRRLVELRPVFEPQDFGETMTSELREQEERILVETERR